MTSSAEQQMAAPVATAPGGGGTGRLDPQWRKAAVAALRGRMAAHRDGEAGYAALASARSLALQAFSRQGTRGKCHVALPPLPLPHPSSVPREPHHFE